MSAFIAKPAAGVLRKTVAKGIRVLRSDQSGTKPVQAGLLALFLTAATLAVRLALDKPLEGLPTLVIFTVPITLSAYFGGLRAGLLATAFAMFGASYYLLPPIHSFAVAGGTERWQLFFVALAGGVISGLNESLHRARCRADALTREHRQAGEALRESEQKFLQLAENMTDAFWMRSPDLREVHYVSPGFERIWGRPVESLLTNPQQWTDFIFPEDRARVAAAFAGLTEDVASLDIEYRIMRPDGEIRWVRVRGFQIRDASGKLIRLTGIVGDITERKAAEDAARRNQRHLRGLIDGLSPSMFVALLTPEGILVEVNAAPLTVAGLKPEDVLGKPFVDTHWWSSSPEAREKLRKAIGRAARGEASRYDVRTRGAGAEIIDIDFSLQPLRDESGKVVFLVPSASVITERTRAEELLAANQNRLRMLCDIMSKAELTFPEKIAEMLRHSAAQLGLESGFLARVEGDQYEMEYVVPETNNFFRGRVVPLHNTICAAVLEHEGPVAVEHTANSEWRLNPSYLKYKFEAYLGVPVQVGGRSAGILCFMSSRPRAEKFTSSDLEFLRLIAQWIGGEIERQTAEAALSTNKLLLEKAVQANQQLLDKSLDVVCTIDAAGRFTSLSAACEKLFGYTPAEMVGRPFLDFMLEDDRASTSAAAALLPTGHELHDYENRYVRKDGRVVTISWSAIWSDADQSIFCVGRDCTERKNAAEAEAARLVAERANVAKSEFLSRMSHELRTPLNAILGFAQVLEVEDGLNSDQRDSVEHILIGGAHLLKLINEVLDISSIEAGRMTISSEPVALPGLLEETVALLRPLSSDFDVCLSVLPAEGVPTHVQADRQRLKQVLLNLIGNAIKYNRPGGSVTVRYHSVAESPSVTRLSVTDTGVGLSPVKLSRLFHPFERLGAEQTQVEGTGLGLVLAKRMVEHMGGAIGVESTPGVGSTFWVELPAAEPPAEPEEPTGDGSAETRINISGQARAVLYIEDNPANVRLVTRILARRPAIRLLCAETGARGLSMAREHRPDLILLDLHLPDSDGECVLERLAAEPRTGAIPVVMLSANAVPGKRAALLAAGARAFMTKPVDVRNFLTLVDQFLE
jgi:PAS domain S-box-containing protein